MVVNDVFVVMNDVGCVELNFPLCAFSRNQIISKCVSVCESNIENVIIVCGYYIDTSY